MVLAVLLLVAATYRLTRFVVADTFPPMAWFRERVARGAARSRVLGYFDELISCPWCASIWIAAGVTAATWHWRDGGLVVPPLVALTASGATGLLHMVEPE